MSFLKSKLIRVVVIFTCIAGLLYVFINKSAAEKTAFDNDKDSFSYAIGVQVAEQLKQGMADDVNAEVFSAAILDVLTDKDLSLTEEQIAEAIDKKRIEEEAAYAKMLEENKEKSDAFFAENKEKEGVMVTDSGIQYEVLEATEVEDAKQPTAESTVLVHYKGTMLDGEEFDSSYKRGEPTELPVNGVIPGWQEVLPMMKEGDKWKIVIPSDLAYGEQGAGGVIGPNEALIFEIELVEVK